MRMDYPRFASEGVQGEYLTAIQAEIAKACAEPGLLLGLRKESEGQADPRYEAGLPWSAMSGALDLSGAEFVVPLVRFPNDQTVVLRMDRSGSEVFHEGKVILLSDGAGRVLSRLLETPGTVQSIIAGWAGVYAKDEVIEGLSTLVRERLVVVRAQ